MKRGFGLRLLAIVAIININLGCHSSMSAEPPHDQQIAIWDGKWKLSDAEINAFSDNTPKYLRISLASGNDLIVDEWFRYKHDADFMSVLATMYGAGEHATIGAYDIVCQRTPSPFYNCGMKFDFNKRIYIILFRNKPVNSDDIREAYENAERFISEKLVEA